MECYILTKGKRKLNEERKENERLIRKHTRFIERNLSPDRKDMKKTYLKIMELNLEIARLEEVNRTIKIRIATIDKAMETMYMQ